MCGIVFATDFTGQPVNKWITHQFEKQRSRGTQGFGLLDGQFNHLIKNPREDKILKWLNKYKSTEILFHHRFPTSTENVQNACHPFSTGRFFETNYVLVHNGWISNAEAMYKKHIKLGIEYSSLQPDGSFNDSEALLWELALTLEGEQEKMECYGAIAFICLATNSDDKRELYFGRNNNPLNMHFTKKHLYLSSEGQGDPITSHSLYCYNYKTKELKSKEFDINSYSSEPFSYSSYPMDYYLGFEYDYSESNAERDLRRYGANAYGWLDKEKKFHLWEDDGHRNTTPPVIKNEPNQLKLIYDINDEYKSYMEMFEGVYVEVDRAITADIEMCCECIDEYKNTEEASHFEYHLKVLRGVEDKLLKDTRYTSNLSVNPEYSGGVVRRVVQQALKATNG